MSDAQPEGHGIDASRPAFSFNISRLTHENFIITISVSLSIHNISTKNKIPKEEAFYTW